MRARHQGVFEKPIRCAVPFLPRGHEILKKSGNMATSEVYIKRSCVALTAILHFDISWSTKLVI